MQLNPTEEDRLRVFTAAHKLASETPVLDGVADLVPEIRVEVLLEEGTRLFVLREPFGPPQPGGPGSHELTEGDVPLLPGRERRRISVKNEGTRPIRVSSHFPFWQVNASLAFDREAARGFRLDIPAGDSIRWAPGEAKEIELVAYVGGTGDA